MKKILALLALVLGVVSCQTEPEGLDVNVGGEVETTVCVSLPEATRANSAVGALDNNVLAGENTLRYILQIYQGIKDNEGNVTEWVASKETKFEYSDEQSVVFPVRLVPNRDYKFVVWADIVKGENAGDNYYITGALNSNNEFITDLTDVTIDATKWNAMDEARDAYTGVVRINDYKSTSSINIPLTRPFAKLRVLTTDMQALANLGLRPEKAVVKYNADHYSAFDALEGKPATDNKISNKSHTITDVATYGEAGTLFVDYFFATEEQETIKFELTVYDQNGDAEVNKIKYNNFNTDIAVQRNYLTTIQGNILTDGNNVTVEVKDAFANYNESGNPTDPNYEYATISSEAEFLAALNSPGKFIVISDLEIANVGDTVSNGQVNRFATRSGSTTIVNLNGHTITLKADIKVEAGNTLIITDINENGEVGAIVSANGGGAIVNKGTLNIEGGHFGADTIKNEDNGVINITGGTISQGAITGDANITGGEFTYNPENEIPDGYKVVETENGKYEVRVGDPIAKIGNETYTTLQAAFDVAEGETTIVLLSDATFKNTSVLAEGKTAVLDLNGKTLAHADETNKYALNNHGTLTIKDSKGNGSINSRGIYNGYGNGGENVTTAKLTIVNGTFNAKGTNGGAAVYNYGTVDVQGGEFTSIGGYSLNNQSGASMTIADGVTANNGVYATNATVVINGGEISGNRSGCHVIYGWNANITINGGTLYNNNSGNSTVMAAGSTKITYNGGTYGIKDGRVPGNGNTWTSCLLDSANSATVVVNDGTYNGGFRVQAGTSMTINGGSFNDCYGSTYNINGTVTVKGGTYTDATAIAFAEKYVADGYVLDDNEVVLDEKVAKVGTTEYRKIEDAIANWTNGSTLTLLKNVTLSDVITLKSTEHHTLDLGTYTMTAASGKNAIEITCNGRTSASYALTVNADGTNPGGITATGKACIYYKKSDSTKDRPIILINNGVFTGSYSINSISNGNTNCPQIWINGGVFNSYMNLTKNLLKVSGGTFHASINCTGDQNAYRLISGGRFKSWQFMTADAPNKFAVSSTMSKDNSGNWIGTYDVGVYVDDEGYLVVGGPVITEFGDKFAAKATNATKWSSYLKYSSAVENGLYYTNADMAIKKHGEANVVLK